EEVEAERARLARLQEEDRYLERLRDRLRVVCPVRGLITTPHLKEKVGQYVREGEVIAVGEEPAGLEVEVTLAEQGVERVRPGQEVQLKARALPYATFGAEVERIAPAAVRGEVQSTLTVYGRLRGLPPELRPGMTGYARVYTGPRALGGFLADRVLR